MNFSLRALIFCSLLFLVSCFLFLANPVFAQECPPSNDPGGQPNPQPCKNVCKNDKLTDNWIADENGNPPINQVISRTGSPGQAFTVSLETFFTVDFSKLQAIFGQTNSDYLEGRFQDEPHRNVDILNLQSTDFNKFHGASQKTTPKVMTDMLRIKYVNYVYNKPELAESTNKYSDINGEDPNTIKELVGKYQLPDEDPDTPEPTPPSLGGDKDIWQNGWAKYWEKIPTAYSEFYEGKIEFRHVVGEDPINKTLNGELCPIAVLREIKFNMPEFFRTTATSGQLNQVIVPKAAQSIEANNPILAAADGAKNTLGAVFQKCIKAATQNPLSQTLRKIIKVSFNYLNPLKNAFAQEDCIKYSEKAKEGQAPYCALPADQLQFGDSCINQNDLNKLDKDNPNVICTFRLYWQTTLIFGDKNTTPAGEFDRCEDTDGNGIADTCYIRVAIWPVVRTPYLSEIWNNTLYSNEAEGAPGAGVGSQQETGRPGVYSAFTPKVIYAQLFENGGIITREDYESFKEACLRSGDVFSDDCDKLWKALDALQKKYPDIPDSCPEPIDNPADLTRCFGAYWQKMPSKNLPGQVSDNVAGAKTSKVLAATSADDKERFVGATDCNKFFTRDIALKPKALQESVGIDKQTCNLEATVPPGPGGPTPTPGPDGGGLDYYIKYGDISIMPDNPAAIKALANSSWPGNNIDKWDYVISQSISRGISPAFSISIWWEEGGFGGAGAYSEFGCFPGGDTSQILSFDDSFNCFLDFTATEHPYEASDPQGSFTRWVRYFCGPAADPICSNNPGFIDRLGSIYNSVAPGEIVDI